MKRWWRILKGAERYRRCRKPGAHRRSDEAAWACARVCAGCDGLIRMRSGRLRAVLNVVFGRPLFWTCGEFGVEVPGRSCGCLVLAETPAGETTPPPGGGGSVIQLTVYGERVRAEPAGKTWCEMESCPRGNW